MDLAIMYNILAEIALLSESLQNRNMTVAYDDKLIRRCIIFIDNIKEKPGTKCLYARVAIKEGNFCGVTLIENIKISAINPQQLLTIMCQSLRLGLYKQNSKQEEYETLLKQLKVLGTFKLTASKIKNVYRDYLEDSSRVSKELNLLFNRIKLIPCCSAKCERGFSQMNLIIFCILETG
ncbi:hypothetical protein PR048_026475 [Dryococelus australis]|uniref:Uncharacterized protein n=1 Tax=Dryococelus australis TaxID=614101 RepID=A0ABQ9GLH6_9NEOP|nr:hypothetical protein PR048_026475 [Dryococelus australis]